MTFPLKKQDGVTLVIALMMLFVLTVFVITAVNLSTTSLKIVGNTQAVEFNEGVAEQAVAEVLSSKALFDVPAVRYIEFDTNKNLVLKTAKTSKAIGEVKAATCEFTIPADGYSATDPLTPEDTIWDIQVNMADPDTNTSFEIHHGVGIRMLAGRCL